MQRTDAYETMLVELERALHLLTLVFEEIDEAPRKAQKEDYWKAAVYCNRADIWESVVYSVYTLLENQTKAIESWIEGDIKNERKNSQ